MKKLIFLFAVLFLFNSADAQTHKNSYELSNIKNFSRTSSSVSFLKFVVMILPINPILSIEGKRFYAGLTKEFSFGVFPYGRAAAEYSFIFRETKVNQIRLSYNFDIPLEVADLGAFLVSIGGGYFTDFSKTGYFPQASFNILLPLDDVVALTPYVKFRNTFMTEESESDIFDFSFGFGTAVYF